MTLKCDGSGGGGDDDDDGGGSSSSSSVTLNSDPSASRWVPL